MGLFSWLFKSKDNTELEQAIAQGAFLVDVRTKAEYDQQHVATSVNIPLDQIADSLPRFKEHKQIVVFCRSGIRSKQAQMILKRKGIDNVRNGGTWYKVNKLKHG